MMAARVVVGIIGIALGVSIGSACIGITDGGYCWRDDVVYEYGYVIHDVDPEIDGGFIMIVDDTTRVEFPDGSWITYRSVPEYVKPEPEG